MIIGPNHHGKTTFANMLARHLGYAKVCSTGDYLVYRVALEKGIAEDEVCARKEEFRKELVRMGDALCNANPGELVAVSLYGVKTDFAVVEGVRRVSELQCVRDWFDCIVWVHRPDTDPGQDNLELDEAHTTETIVNDGSLSDLETKAAAMAARFTSEN